MIPYIIISIVIGFLGAFLYKFVKNAYLGIALIATISFWIIPSMATHSEKGIIGGILFFIPMLVGYVIAHPSLRR